MNMISEQIKELRNYERIFNGDRIDGNLSPIFGNAANTIEELSEKLKNSGWIPCSERLPEENQNAIACFAHGTVTELRFYDKKFHGIYDYDEKVIVAWQPLPEAYHE